MLSHIRNLLIITVLGGGAFLLSPEPQQAEAADGYWKSYWGWYDNTYRPYYNRQYYNNNYYNYNRGWDDGYGYDSPYNRYYGGNRYYSPYRGTYGSYYRGNPYGYGRNNITLGDFSLSWR